MSACYLKKKKKNLHKTSQVPEVDQLLGNKVDLTTDRNQKLLRLLR